VSLETPLSNILETMFPDLAREHDAHVVHINTEPADTTDTTTLTGRAGEWLPKSLAAPFGTGLGN
jgi:hypothetical protein